MHIQLKDVGKYRQLRRRMRVVFEGVEHKNTPSLCFPGPIIEVSFARQGVPIATPQHCRTPDTRVVRGFLLFTGILSCLLAERCVCGCHSWSYATAPMRRLPGLLKKAAIEWVVISRCPLQPQSYTSRTVLLALHSSLFPSKHRLELQAQMSKPYTATANDTVA